jgi:glutathione peroxidase
MKKIWYLFASGAVVFALKSCLFSQSKNVDNPTAVQPTSSFHDLQIASLDGKDTIRLSAFKGKKVLIVNTASECGYTPQYEELEQLHRQMKDSLVIIGCPCNQFGGQEPGGADEIRSFCQKNYGVSFILTEKIDVKGANQHPLYRWLTQKSLNGALDASVGWNFNKFLVDGEGKLLGYYPSKVKPMAPELLSAIRGN